MHFLCVTVFGDIVTSRDTSTLNFSEITVSNCVCDILSLTGGGRIVYTTLQEILNMHRCERFVKPIICHKSVHTEQFLSTTLYRYACLFTPRKQERTNRTSFSSLRITIGTEDYRRRTTTTTSANTLFVWRAWLIIVTEPSLLIAF